MPDLQCIVVTPERTVCRRQADFVVLTLYDGEYGVAPGHTPMMGRLGYGEMRISDQHGTARYYIEGGFAEVADGVVTVLTNRAISAEKLDEAVIREQLDAARSLPGNTPELLGMREIAVAQRRAQLRVARRRK